MIDRADRGAALVELAITIPVLILIGTTVLDYGFMLRERSMMTQAALAGARAGALRQSGTAPAAVSNAIRDVTRAFITAARETPAEYEVNIQNITVTLADSTTVPAVQVCLTRAQARFLWIPRILNACVKTISRLAPGNTADNFSEGSGNAC